MKSLKTLGALIAAAFVMTACGGGGSSGTDSPAGNGSGDTPDPVGGPIAGAWMGSMTWNDQNHDHPYIWDTTEIALPNGDYYHVFNHYFHTETETQRNTMGGFAVGKVTTDQDGKFAVNEAYEYSFIEDFPDRPIRAEGSYSAGDMLGGQFIYDPKVQEGQDISRDYSAKYNTDYSGQLGFEDLNFNNPDQRSIQGVLWSQKAARPDDSYKTPMQLVVNPDGSLASRFTTDCQVSGQLQPHPEVKVYQATVTLGTNCPYPGYTFNGIAYLQDSVPSDTAPDITKNRFYLVATNRDGGMNRGILFVQMVEAAVQPEDLPPVQ